MAIDLNKPIGAPVASTALPTKKTMNLYARERKGRGVWKYLLGALGLLLLVGLFAKFAVFDVLSQVDLKRAELSAAQQELDSLQRQLDGYDDVLADYHAYTGVAQTSGHDALEVIDMVARVVGSKAKVTAVATSEDSLSVNVKGISLDDLGKLADSLRSEEMVDSVVVSNAADEDAKSVAASIVVQLVSSEGEGAAQ